MRGQELAGQCEGGDQAWKQRLRLRLRCAQADIEIQA